LIRSWLEAPIVEQDQDGKPKVSRPKQGTPQGGVISPLLANLYLHWFDVRFQRPGGPGRWAGAQLVRYADDFVILARYQGQRLQEWVERTVEDWLGLRINREKTRVVNLNEPGASLDFLGYTFRYYLDPSVPQGRLVHGRGTRYLNVAPSKAALKRERVKLRALIGPAAGYVPVRTLIREANQHLRGWAGYFGYGYPRQAFRAINWYVRERLTAHLRRRSQRRYRVPHGSSVYEHLRQQGLVYL
jgi:RNA-directed DNA polymerase